MAKSKKKKQKDFQKVKLKVGKKLKKGDNVTNASFKTRTVQVSQKLKTAAGIEPSTKKKRNITELLGQCRHYNTTVRQEAVTGLKELIITFPELAQSHIADILEKASELLTDKEASVRHGAGRLFKAFIPNISEKQISPFFPLLCAHLCCAMTHIFDDIQVDSLYILDLLLDHYPKLLVNKSNQVLANFVEQISRLQTKGKGQQKRSLTINPNSKTSSLKWRASVLKRLQKFLSAILQIHKETNVVGATNECDSDHDVTFTSGKMALVQLFPRWCCNQWEEPGFTINNLGQSQGEHSEDRSEGRKLEEFIRTLVPLLIESWVESAPSEHLAEGNMLRWENASILSAILNVTQLLWDCIATIFTSEQQDRWKREKCMKDMHHHFLTNFPYSVQGPSQVNKKEKNYEQVPAEVINLTICDIVTNVLEDSTNQHERKEPVRLSVITLYLRDFLVGGFGTSMIGQNCKVIVQIVEKLMKTGVCNDSVSRITKVMFRRFKSANPAALEKRVYLQFFAECLLDVQDTEVISPKTRDEFLKCLPELLPIAARGNPQMTTLLIKIMKQAACQKCASFLNTHFLNGSGREWFDPAGGVIGKLQSCDERELIGLLYFVPDFGLQLIKTLTSLARSNILSEADAGFLIQVLHNRYLRTSKEQQAVVHLVLLSNLVIGCSKEKMCSSVMPEDTTDYIQDVGARFSLIPDTLDTDGASEAHWNRHKFLLQMVGHVTNQFVNSNQVTTVIFNFVRNVLMDTTVLPWQVAYGICKFADSSDSRPAEAISVLSNLASSLVLHAVTWEKMTNHSAAAADECKDVGCSLLLKLPAGVESFMEVIVERSKDGLVESVPCIVDSTALLLLKAKHRGFSFSDVHVTMIRQILTNGQAMLDSIRNSGKEQLIQRITKSLVELDYTLSTTRPGIST